MKKTMYAAMAMLSLCAFSKPSFASDFLPVSANGFNPEAPFTFTAKDLFAPAVNTNNVLGASTATLMESNTNANASSASPDGITSTEGYHRSSRGGGGGGDKSFSAGAQLQYSSYGGGTGLHFMGLGLVGELGLEKFALRFTFLYNFPQSTTLTTSTYATANDPFNPVPEVPVTETDKWTTNVMNICFDGKKVFGDYSDGGFYLFAGIGLSLASESDAVTYSQYDATNYTAPASSASSASFSQWYIRLGAGYDLKLGNGKAFAEAGLDLAANQQNGQTVDVTIPTFFHFAAGYRFSFGK